MSVMGDQTTGILDPDDSGCWLVRPWPTEASFCEVVRYFLTAYISRLQSDTSTARQRAYFEGYQAALDAAPTHELTYAADWRWYEDLRDCVGRCVATYQDKRMAATVWRPGLAG